MAIPDGPRVATQSLDHLLNGPAHDMTAQQERETAFQAGVLATLIEISDNLNEIRWHFADERRRKYHD